MGVVHGARKERAVFTVRAWCDMRECCCLWGVIGPAGARRPVYARLFNMLVTSADMDAMADASGMTCQRSARVSNTAPCCCQ